VYEDSYLDQQYEERFEMFEPTPDQELDWAIHNDHAGDWDDDLDDGGMVEFGDYSDESYDDDYSDDFNDGEWW
jgi:hypothetical protein